jgi:hypothetical protein
MVNEAFPCKSSIKQCSYKAEHGPRERLLNSCVVKFSDNTSTQESLDSPRVSFAQVKVRMYDQFPLQGEWEHSDLDPVCIDDFEADRKHSKKPAQSNSSSTSGRQRRESEIVTALVYFNKKNVDRAREKILKEANKDVKRGKKKNTFFGRWFPSRKSSTEPPICQC